MAAHVESGASKSFAIWNPIDLGYAATMISYNLAKGEAKATAGGQIPMGRLGSVELGDSLDGAMADPFVYDASNIDEFKDCLLYTSPSPRDQRGSRMPSSA